MEPTEDSESTQDDAEAEADARADNWAIVIIFTALVLAAVHFISGWRFDF